MVVEPLMDRIRKKKKKMKNGRSPPAEGDGAFATLGILSFEVANIMSRAVHLHRSLSDGEVSHLRELICSSSALHSFVSSQETYLFAIAVAEKLDELNRVAALASRFGRRCSILALQGFEHVYKDLLAGRIDPATIGFLSRDVDGIIRKMERLASSTVALYAELEALTDLEQSAKKFPPTHANEETRKVFEEKIYWQRREVKQLRVSSLWNQSYDKVVLLLARAVCTIHSRICHVLGDSISELQGLSGTENRLLSRPMAVHGHLPPHSGLLGSDSCDHKSGRILKSSPLVEPSVNFSQPSLRFNCAASPARLFLECLSLGSPTSWKTNQEIFEEESCVSQAKTGSLSPFSIEQNQKRAKVGRSWFGPKSRLTMLAPPSSVGGSALALHYANVIIIIEKLLSYPHLVGEEARDDLYQMLPSSLKATLRKSLKSYAKDMAIYDAPVAHGWKEALYEILNWLSPMAHNMIRWQAERNFEQQKIVQRGNVLLLQTIYFADREKTEETICELLVGLNYICRYEQQQNALLDCSSSLDFEESIDLHMRY